MFLLVSFMFFIKIVLTLQRLKETKGAITIK